MYVDLAAQEKLREIMEIAKSGERPRLVTAKIARLLGDEDTVGYLADEEVCSLSCRFPAIATPERRIRWRDEFIASI